MEIFSKFSKTKTFIFGELQIEVLLRVLKSKLSILKKQKIDNFENIENEFSVKSLITKIEDAPWNEKTN